MQFLIKKRDGPSRIGELIIDNKKIVTPNILFINTSRFKAPSFSEILLTNKKSNTKKPAIKIEEKDFMPRLLETIKEKYHLEFEKNLITLQYAKQIFQRPKKFVDLIADLKQKKGSAKAIFAPGIAVASNLCLLTYLGIDLFDSSSAIVAARDNIMFFSDGEYKKEELTELPCNCPICCKKEKSSELSFEEILSHNYYMFFNELKQVRNMIKTGNLRNYVEKKVQANPMHATILRNMDTRHYNYLEENTAVVNSKTIYATSIESFSRPEIKRFQKRVIHRYRKPSLAKILLLLPCSARKPYSFSKTHRFLRRKVLETNNPDIIHELIITSPLGLVPRELELTYPAANYDIPVTGIWSEDEKKMIKELLTNYLSKNKYEKIIVHLPENIVDFIKDVIKKPVVSCINSPTSDESLENLYTILEETSSSFKKVDKKERQNQNVESLASFQFGIKPARVLLKNTSISGRYPNLRITQDKKQIGMLTGDRGFISLTLEGAEKIKEVYENKVDISDDFKPKGSILAPGIIDASDNIRIGDEVLIFRKNKLAGVGAACMNGFDMKKLGFGEAIKIRHIKN